MAIKSLGGLLLRHLIAIGRLAADIDSPVDLRASREGSQILVVDLLDLVSARVPGWSA